MTPNMICFKIGVPDNKELLSGTLPDNKKVLSGTLPDNNLFHNINVTPMHNGIDYWRNSGYIFI